MLEFSIFYSTLPSFIFQYVSYLSLFFLFLWPLLRVSLFFYHRITRSSTLHFPSSCQKMGIAQGIALYDVILSWPEYYTRFQNIRFFDRFVRIYWPLSSWILFLLFSILFTAYGLTLSIQSPFILNLFFSIFLFGSLGLFRRNLYLQQIILPNLPEGAPLQWSPPQTISGIHCFERSPQSFGPTLLRFDHQALSRDANQIYTYARIQAQPDSVFQHGNGLLVSSYYLTRQSSFHLSEIPLAELLQAILTTYLVAQHYKKTSACLLESEQGCFFLVPHLEHIDFLLQHATKLLSRKKVPTISARDVCLSAAQSFPHHFSAELLSQIELRYQWTQKNPLPL